jgi:hypothetical protein
MSITAPRKEGDLLYAGGIYAAGVCLKLDSSKPDATVHWKGEQKTGLYGANCTPFIENGVMYGCDGVNGAFRAVKLDTGERLWETFAPTTGTRNMPHGTAFIVKSGDRFFLFSETGNLIIAKLSPKGYEEISRAKIIEPTHSGFGGNVVWSHPAFANKCCYARNDKELVCVDLAEGK